MNRKQQMVALLEMAEAPDSVLAEVFTEYEMAAYQEWINTAPEDHEKRLQLWAGANAIANMRPYLTNKLKGKLDE